MGEGRGASRKALEARAVEAHRAYLDALVVWERALHLITCPVCRPSGHADHEAELRCELAELDKERRRIAFRDLCGELGHVPQGYGSVLPPEEPACCGPRVPDA